MWTHVYLKDNDTTDYIGFYGNSLDGKMNESIKYNEDYILFYYINPYAGNAEFIKKIYDINTKECLGYNEYPEFVETKEKTLTKVK